MCLGPFTVLLVSPPHLRTLSALVRARTQLTHDVTEALLALNDARRRRICMIQDGRGKKTGQKVSLYLILCFKSYIFIKQNFASHISFTPVLYSKRSIFESSFAFRGMIPEVTAQENSPLLLLAPLFSLCKEDEWSPRIKK